MSRSNASARQRRAGVIEPPPPPISAPSSTQAPSGLTLQQVISVIDTRLIKLEKFMKETPLQPPSLEKSGQSITFDESGSNGVDSLSLTQILDDFNNRFMLLAEEIASLKDTLLKLQTYTMDVNKMLLDERVNVLSDLGEDKGMFIMGDDTSLSNNEIEKIESTLSPK